jgi:hypothetical protein
MATLNDTLNSKTGPDVVSAPAMRQMPAEANARRLVACWNACQSIPTEALEAGVVGELVEAVRKAALWVGQYKALPAHKPAAEAMLVVLEAALAKMNLPNPRK